MAGFDKTPGWYNVELPDGTGASGTSYANLFKNSGEYTYSEGNGSGQSGSICGPERTSQCSEEEYWFEVPLVNWDTDEVEVTKGAKKYSSCNNEMLVTWFNNGGNTYYNSVINNVDIFEIKNIDDCSQVISTKDTTTYPFITGNTKQNFEENNYVDSGFPLIVTDPYDYNNKCFISQNENYTPKYGGNTIGHKISYLPFSNTIPSQCITGNPNLVELYFPHVYNKYEDDKFNEVRRTRVISDEAFSGNTGLSAVTFSAVEKIGKRAFFGCIGLKNIDWFHRCTDSSDTSDKCKATISGRTIGEEAFRYCISLPRIDLMPLLGAFDGVDHTKQGTGQYPDLPPCSFNVEKYAFADCMGATALTIAHLAAVPEGCFSNCTSLENVTISGDSTATIGDKAFSGCTSLSGINIPTGVTSIGDNAFDGCAFDRGYVSNGVIYAGTYQDGNTTKYACIVGVTEDFKTGTTSFNVPSGVRFICSNAFDGCVLTSITIPNTVKQIRSEAFKNCLSLNAINIPTSVTYINTSAFIGCTALPTASNGFTYAGDVFLVNSNGQSLQNRSSFNSTVKYIGDYSFCGNTNVTAIEFPSNLEQVGKYAFSGCTNLTNVRAQDKRICMLNTIDKGAFMDCTNLTSVNTKRSADYSLYNLSYIKDDAFRNCVGLTTIDIPYSDYVGDNVYNGCSLTSVTIGNSYDYISDKAFSGCPGIKEVFLNTERVDDWFKGFTSISSVTIGSSCQEISDNAFSGCTGLVNVVIMQNVKKIGDNVFKGCISLPISADNVMYADCCVVSAINSSSITIKDDAKFICNEAFKGNTGMTGVSIPDSVIDIGKNAFSGCTKLKSVTSACKTIKDDAFVGCTGLTSCTMSNIQDIGKEAFMNCTSLSSITLPSTIKDIHEYAFKKCTKLKTINVEAYKDESNNPPLSEIPILRYSALLDCPSDMNIYVPSGETANYRESYSWDEYGDRIKENTNEQP